MAISWLLRVPWTARKSSQSIQKEISPEYSLEGLMLKLKLQYFGHLMLTHLKRPWCWERLKANRTGGGRGCDVWMASWTQWRWVWVNSGSWWWTGSPGVLWSMGSQKVSCDWVTELSWTELRQKSNSNLKYIYCISHHSLWKYIPQCSYMLLFSHQDVSDTLWSYGLQHTRPLCPSP